jgi:hypothetical protein
VPIYLLESSFFKLPLLEGVHNPNNLEISKDTIARWGSIIFVCIQGKLLGYEIYRYQSGKI